MEKIVTKDNYKEIETEINSLLETGDSIIITETGFIIADKVKADITEDTFGYCFYLDSHGTEILIGAAFITDVGDALSVEFNEDNNIIFYIE